MPTDIVLTAKRTKKNEREKERKRGGEGDEGERERDRTKKEEREIAFKMEEPEEGFIKAPLTHSGRFNFVRK